MYLIYFILFVNCVLCDVRVDPLVLTTQGLVKGSQDDGCTVFLGIPYARVERGNPFGPAEPYPRFNTIYEAHNDPPACPQMKNGTTIGSLDCLSLNIFVPTHARPPLAVIVWLHGGSFNVGRTTSQEYNPKRLVERGVIVVTLNYRLGPYGFMCSDAPGVSGNQGIRDQALAMEWVEDNIQSFGGDVDRITLMGESAGAGSIEAHILSGNNRTFKQVILQSGTLLKPDGVIEADVELPIKIAEKLNFKADNTSDAIAFLSRTDPDLVIAATSVISPNLRVCIESESNDESVVKDRPYNIDVEAKDLTILAGFNDREALLMNKNKPNGYLNNTNYFYDILNQVFISDDGLKDVADIVRKFYIGDEELDERARDDVIDFQSDFFYNYPIQWSLDRFLQNGARVYQYVFTHDGGLNYMKNVLGISSRGACHGDELGYLFGMTGNGRAPTEVDRLVVERLTTMWTNFAKYGNPTPDRTELLPIIWKPITEDSISYLEIGSELVMKNRPFQDRLAFWKLLFLANRDKLRGIR